MKKHTFFEKQIVQLPYLRGTRKDTVVLFGEVLADMFPDKNVLGGAPFNVARHLKAFDLNPVIITSLGHDDLGDEVLKVMSENNMETFGIQRSNEYPTGQALVHIKDGRHHFEILPSQAYDFIDQMEMGLALTSVKPALIYFGTLAQRYEISNQTLMFLLHSVTGLKFLDINLRFPWYNPNTLQQSLQNANIVKLNTDELTILAKMFDLPENNQEEQIRKLLDLFNIRRAMVTCGDAGAWQVDRHGKIFKVGIDQKITHNFVDSVGAGDGFSAVCILGTLRGWSIVTTMKRANSFASAICQIRGAIPEHPDFYAPFCKKWDS